MPLSQAFLWLLLLHALDTPNRRGLMVLLVSSLVLVALAGVLSISMAIAPWLVVWALAALVSLVLAYRAELEELPALDGSSPPRFSPRISWSRSRCWPRSSPSASPCSCSSRSRARTGR